MDEVIFLHLKRKKNKRMRRKRIEITNSLSRKKMGHWCFTVKTKEKALKITVSETLLWKHQENPEGLCKGHSRPSCLKNNNLFLKRNLLQQSIIPIFSHSYLFYPVKRSSTHFKKRKINNFNLVSPSFFSISCAFFLLNMWHCTLSKIKWKIMGQIV